MESKREPILKQKEEAELKVQQYQHKIQLLENRKKHLEKKANRLNISRLGCHWHTFEIHQFM